MAQLDPYTDKPLNHMMLDLTKGVSFRDCAGANWMVKKWGDEIWLFYFNRNGDWVSNQPAKQSHINMAAKYNSPRRA